MRDEPYRYFPVMFRGNTFVHLVGRRVTQYISYPFTIRGQTGAAHFKYWWHCHPECLRARGNVFYKWGLSNPSRLF